MHSQTISSSFGAKNLAFQVALSWGMHQRQPIEVLGPRAPVDVNQLIALAHRLAADRGRAIVSVEVSP